ncbi:HlyD family efflux transporter periplasmic adaptor subunit [Chloroflexales bacterium ZM16-3]|nr:HlyD family efflux transporter periplasmic adaptor subunit [Chloroflexales bacterium ZM16-3]
MTSRRFATILAAGLLGLAACAAPAASTSPTAIPVAPVPTEASPMATAAPTVDPAAQQQPGTAPININSALAITAEGAIMPTQDASLLFGVQGTVGTVLVHEGDHVDAGQVLAGLTTEALDLQVAQAQAALAGAQAALAGVDEGPRAASVAAAQAQVRSAEAALAQLKAGPKVQDVTSAQAGLAAAQANMESQRINLSSAKNRADSAVEQAANALRSAQDSYSTTYWKNRELEKLPGDLPQSAKDAEAAALRAVSNAEEGLRQAEIAAESARLAEQTGIQAAEQQVNQAQAALDKLQAGATSDQIAAATAQVAQARSQLDALTNPTTASQRAQREASVAQAQAALESAQYNRSQADLKAPFAGVVAEVNIDVGDPSSSAGAAAIRLIDLSDLTAEVDVSDVDIAGVQVGQHATLLVQSLPNVTFSGKVIYIAPAATVNGNVRTYTVRISIDDQSGLLSGMRVRATITPAT